MTSGYGVQAFDPATGAILWGNEWTTKMNPRVVQPNPTPRDGINLEGLDQGSDPLASNDLPGSPTRGAHRTH